MAKRKNGPALLELMQREQEDAANRAAIETDGRRSWLNRGSREHAPGAVDIAAPPEEAEVVAEPMLEPASPPEPPPQPPPVEDRPLIGERREGEPASPPRAVEAPPDPAVGAEPIDSFEPPWRFRIEEGRVHLSLNPVSSVVAGGTVLLAIFAGFVMGRVTASSVGAQPEPGPAAVSPIEEAVQGEARPQVLVDPTGERAEAAKRKAIPAPAAPKVTVVPGTDPRERGKNYFQLMTANPEDREDAQDAREFLADHGITAWVVENRQKQWLVFDVSQGFTRQEIGNPAFRQRKSLLERLGVKFFKANRSYDFKPFAVKAPDR